MKQTIAIDVLPNISRSKDNQTMKFEYLTQKATVCSKLLRKTLKRLLNILKLNS